MRVNRLRRRGGLPLAKFQDGERGRRFAADRAVRHERVDLAAFNPAVMIEVPGRELLFHNLGEVIACRCGRRGEREARQETEKNRARCSWNDRALIGRRLSGGGGGVCGCRFLPDIDQFTLRVTRKSRSDSVFATKYRSVSGMEEHGKGRSFFQTRETVHLIKELRSLLPSVEAAAQCDLSGIPERKVCAADRVGSRFEVPRPLGVLAGVGNLDRPIQRPDIRQRQRATR